MQDSVPVAQETTGRFRVLGELGEGGAARVYLAVARGPAGFNKLLVLKQPRDQSLSSDELGRFLGEARLAARLNHPNIVQTYEVTEERGLPCIVMEYLDGQPLSNVITKCKEQLTLGMHLRVLADTLAGLHCAHELADYDGTSLQLVHRDISPQNVFVTFDGQVKVLDFGLAKVARASVDVTETGVIKGKIRYMPPEQIAGEPIDRRADIFAVGVMLWEALTRRRMWEEQADITVFKRVLNGQIPSVRSVQPDVPEDLEGICMKALSFDKVDRYATATDFELAIDAAIEKLGLRATNREIGKMLNAALADVRAGTRAIVERQLGKVASLSWEDYRKYQNAGVVRLASGALQTGTPREMHLDVSLQPDRLGRTIAAYGAIVIGVLGIVAIFALRPSTQSHTTPNPSELPSPGTYATPAESAAPAVVSGPSVQKNVRVRFTATPTDAKLYWDGTLLSSNPFENTMLADDKGHTLRAEAPGYDAAQTSVALDNDADILLTLQRRKVDQGSQTKPRSAKPAKPPQFVDEL